MSHIPIRNLIRVFILGLAILIVYLFVFSGNFPIGKTPDDFIAYWSSAELLLTGGDPYSPLETQELTEEIGFGNAGRYLSFFYPPWTIPLFLPFGVISYHQSRALWFLVSLIVYVASAIWIWNLYGGKKNKIWFLIPCIFLISPVIFALLEGQATPFILLGLVGFLYFEKQGKWFAAGSILVLSTIKPHIIYLFWIALLIWLIYSRNWQIFAGFILTLVLSSLLVFINDPLIFMKFIHMTSENLPTYCSNPSLASLLCSLAGQRQAWHVWLGPVLGLTWLSAYWIRNNSTWDWMSAMPMLIFISLITIPYTWMHDGLLFTIAVIEIAILFIDIGPSVKRLFLAMIFTIVNIIIFSLSGNFRDNQILFVWVPSIYLILYWISKMDFSYSIKIGKIS